MTESECQIKVGHCSFVLLESQQHLRKHVLLGFNSGASTKSTVYFRAFLQCLFLGLFCLTAGAQDRDTWDVILRWKPVAGAKYYRVQIARDHTFKEILRQEDTPDLYFVWQYQQGMENSQGLAFYRLASIGTERRAGEFSEPVKIPIPKDVLPLVATDPSVELECSKISQDHTLSVSRYESGKKKFEACVLDKTEDGPYRSWYESGTLRAQGYFNKGAMNRYWMRWHETGFPRDAGSWKEGKPDGSWDLFRPDGMKKEAITFEEGIECSRQNWIDENDQLTDLPLSKTEYFSGCLRLNKKIESKKGDKYLSA
ncbi:MAG: hypothetical protein AABZ55_11425, partial [Bdellovibrionota bacterium]